ncbi:MAG: NFACT RNA binding domain-containing protein [Lentisphaeria bacterium]|jgi:predicted ribosome quality control (RQC) complex YloA/Tae2 family protein|nr:NFACT RNA binding domain-containing protein [Lentisphaeria bacterium]
MTNSMPEPDFRYWHYELGSGWQVFAGKSSRDNERLSLHFALPGDYWFHAGKHAGSHVILRAPEAGMQPEAGLLQQAAAIAAWHSKGRHEGLCQVDCVLARQVGKTKGSPVGTVSIGKARKLKVRPALPALGQPD